MSNNPIVSVVVPCYNVEKKIKPLLESLINQTYNNLELIFVNDGSTDKTENIILSYKNKFESLGMDFILIRQENRGLGGAVETGFKLVKGDYLIWPDADDWLEKESIEIRMNYLEKNPEYSCVSSDVAIYNEDDLKNMTGVMSQGRNYLFEENQFENLLYYRAIFCPGAHMIRMKDMDKANPKRILYPSRAGQNIQLLMPISYGFKRAYIDKPLYNYVVYKDSLSRMDYKSAEKGYETFDRLREVYEKTLEYLCIPNFEKKSYFDIIEKSTIRQKYLLANVYMDSLTEKIMYKRLKEKDMLSADIRKIHVKRHLWRLRKLINSIRK